MYTRCALGVVHTMHFCELGVCACVYLIFLFMYVLLFFYKSNSAFFFFAFHANKCGFASKHSPSGYCTLICMEYAEWQTCSRCHCRCCCCCCCSYMVNICPTIRNMQCCIGFSRCIILAEWVHRKETSANNEMHELFYLAIYLLQIPNTHGIVSGAVAATLDTCVCVCVHGALCNVQCLLLSIVYQRYAIHTVHIWYTTAE